MVEGLVLTDGVVLISQVVQVVVDFGEPNCKLIDPYVIDTETLYLQRWMGEVTEQTSFMMSSDNILTIFQPKLRFVDEYRQLNGITEELTEPDEVEDDEDGDGY